VLCCMSEIVRDVPLRDTAVAHTLPNEAPESGHPSVPMRPIGPQNDSHKLDTLVHMLRRTSRMIFQ